MHVCGTTRTKGFISFPLDFSPADDCSIAKSSSECAHKADNFFLCARQHPPGRRALDSLSTEWLWHYIGFCVTLFCVRNNVEQLCSWFIQFEKEREKVAKGAHYIGGNVKRYSTTKNDSFECHLNGSMERAQSSFVSPLCGRCYKATPFVGKYFPFFLRSSSAYSAQRTAWKWKLRNWILLQKSLWHDRRAHIRWSIVHIKLPNASSQKSCRIAFRTRSKLHSSKCH